MTMVGKRKRPLSPHLQIYRPQITSVLSISHRLTGLMLFLGALVMFCWLTAATLGSDAYQIARGLINSWLGILLLFGIVFSLWYHLANGIRHLFWDVGLGFELSTVQKSGVFVVVFSIIMTALTYTIHFLSIGKT